MEYNRIIYPERAEYLNEGKFSGYKIFLDHWNEIASRIKNDFEEALLRRVSKGLIIYGQQSTGKTLLANKIAGDFRSSQASAGAAQPYNDANIWHRIASGFGRNPELIAKNTQASELLHIEDDKQWVQNTQKFCGSNTTRTCIVIADNCERDYFIQNLVGLTDNEFLTIGRTDALVKAAAQRFVALCRGELRGALIIMLTNDDLFALAFEEAVNSQHRGLVTTSTMPLPNSRDKETVVRVNTNRLNPFSYWYCLDRAGMDEKRNVLRTLKRDTGYKDAFEAVDSAIQKATPSRMGRPPKKCLLSLFAMTDLMDVSTVVDSLNLGSYERNVDVNPVIDFVTYTDNWANNFDTGDLRRAKLLQSEWIFRLVVTGNQFVSLLLSGTDNALSKEIVDMALRHHGPGTYATTLNAYRQQYAALVSKVLQLQTRDLSSFWSAGQVRAHDYERALRSIYPSYNTGGPGFLLYRPDLIVETYHPCQISNCPSEEDTAINDAIRRSAIVCEFTAIKDISLETIKTYLNRKLPNYIEILQEQ